MEVIDYAGGFYLEEGYGKSCAAFMPDCEGWLDVLYDRLYDEE